MGINSPSLYAAFGSKESLFREAVALYDATDGAVTERALREEPTARSAIEAMLRGNAIAYTDPDKPRGCMIVLAATTYAPGIAGLRDHLAQYTRTVLDALARRLVRAVAEGELSAGTDTAALAGFYNAVRDGLSIQARDGASREELCAVVDYAMTAWNALTDVRAHDTGGALSDVDVLESVLAKDATLLAAISPEQLSAPTPCPEYDVQALVNHIVGWLQAFAAAANGQIFEGDPADFVSTDPVTDFQTAAASLVAGWRAGGVDRTLRLTGPELPAQMVLAMTLMEYVTHGCDLATATGQTPPFSEAELALTLERARATLPDQYRGEGKPFGHVIAVAEDAPVLDRLLGFMGRQP